MKEGKHTASYTRSWADKLWHSAAAKLSNEEALAALRLARREPGGLALQGMVRKSFAYSWMLIALAGIQWCHAGAVSAASLFNKESARKRIITFCSPMDEMLGGGVAAGQITEFCELHRYPGQRSTVCACQYAAE